MTATAEVTDSKFSIFHPVITFEHREFYERIISELNGIFPICNQGKCTAVEISENVTEQEQITDLMKKVENFSRQLLEVSKRLFDQFYQAKEDFCQSIYSNTAYININLMDRNLLERTCDVRWWSLETAFADSISLCDQVDEDIAGIAEGIAKWAESAGPASELGQRLSRVQGLIRDGAGVLANPTVHRWLMTDLEELSKDSGLIRIDAGLGDRLTALIERVAELINRLEFASSRLEDINSSYTLYRDLVICNKAGRVLASSNNASRTHVLGSDVSTEAWFIKALETKDGTEYHAEDLSVSLVEPDTQSLIYTTAVRSDADTNGRVIGVMGVYFDFQGEAQMILDDYLPKDQRGTPLDGWYTFFSNDNGVVIGSSDEAMVPVGNFAHVSRHHRSLEKGERIHSYGVFEGQESAVFSAKTDGYLEYDGLGWTSHVVLPKSVVFQNDFGNDESLISGDELMHSRLIPDINKETYVKVQDDKESIQLISLNGIVFASKLGKRGVALGPIFDQITKTGDFATSMMEKLLAEMAVGELHMNLQAMANSSKQAIDLIDRNLFERSADIRWWATDQFFWKALEEPDEEAFDAASRRLKVINGSYTMYRNLVLADSNGDIVACSRLEMRNELRKLNVSDHEWFQSGMRTVANTDYAVQDVTDSPLEKTKERSLIYVCGVRAGGARNGESIGVLGIMFDWDTEALTILKTCLPHGADGEVLAGSAAFYTNAQHEIIETTDPERFPVGSRPPLPADHADVAPGESRSGLVKVDATRYLIGSARTKGYREYEGLGWKAHILRPLD